VVRPLAKQQYIWQCCVLSPQGLPDRMGKHDGAAVQRLAALYGLKCTAQGAGKRLTIMVRPTGH
jgi:hypothetical protein